MNTLQRGKKTSIILVIIVLALVIMSCSLENITAKPSDFVINHHITVIDETTGQTKETFSGDCSMTQLREDGSANFTCRVK